MPKAKRRQTNKDLRVQTQKVKGEEWRRVDPEGMDPKLQNTLDKMNPKQVALFCAWVVNGRNISAAARQVGYAPSYARYMFTQEPAFKEAKKYLKDIVLMEDQEWIDCLPQARQTLRSLLVAKDEKVKYLAAKDIVDRAEGKPTTRVDMTVREDKPSMTDAQLQLAFSLMKSSGIGFAEAAEWIRSHPEESQKWIESNVTPQALPAGREVTPAAGPSEIEEAEVVEEKPVESPLSSTDRKDGPVPTPEAPSQREGQQRPLNGRIRPPHRPLIARVD